MKVILMVLMFASLLFSWQKQIILGSYSVQSNGERALATIDKQISADIQLEDFMKEYSLRTINTEISTYTVVSINAFESFTSIVNTMNALKVYYPDAFILEYPTKSIAKKENLLEIQAKAMIEVEIENTFDKDKRAELQKLLEEDALESELLDIDALNEVQEEIIVDVSELREVEKMIEPVLQEQEIYMNESKIDVKKTDIQSEEMSEVQEYILYLIILAVFALLAAGITVFKIASAKEKDSEEDA